MERRDAWIHPVHKHKHMHMYVDMQFNVLLCILCYSLFRCTNNSENGRGSEK